MPKNARKYANFEVFCLVLYVCIVKKRGKIRKFRALLCTICLYSQKNNNAKKRQKMQENSTKFANLGVFDPYYMYV